MNGAINKTAWNTRFTDKVLPQWISLFLFIIELNRARKTTKVYSKMKEKFQFGFRLTYLVVLLLVYQANNLFSQPTGYELKKVVIDPGHGGKDPGAIGTGRYKATESTLVLDVSLRLRDYILQNYNDVEVVMTRSKDEFLTLLERSKKANEAKADLFLSIHCNSNKNTLASGSETFVLGVHKNNENMEVAKRENQVIFLEENYKENYAGFDNSPESMIALSMMQSKYLEQSIVLADMVQRQFRERVGRKDRGVKQAGFWVISHNIMPSILIELGFISNPAEEDFLNSEQGKVYMASAMYRAFKDYKIYMEGVDKSIKTTQTIETKIEDSEKNEKNLEANETKEELKKEDKPKVNPIVEKSGSSHAESSNEKAKSENNDAVGVVFKVQIASSTTKIVLKPENFNGLINVEEEKVETGFKYTVGNTSVFSEALSLQREIREKSYKDAFIVALYNGKRITLQEAFEIQKKQSN